MTFRHAPPRAPISFGSITRFQRRSSKDRHGIGLSGRERGSHDRDRGSSAGAETSFSAESFEGGFTIGTRAEGKFVRREDVFPEIAHTLENQGAIRRSNGIEITHEKIQNDPRANLGTFGYFAKLRVPRTTYLTLPYFELKI